MSDPNTPCKNIPINVTRATSCVPLLPNKVRPILPPSVPGEKSGLYNIQNMRMKLRTISSHI